MKKIIIVSFLILPTVSFSQSVDTLRNEMHYYYLADLDLRSVANMILEDKVSPSDNYVTFGILDSINSKYLESRQFFRPVFDNILFKSDGALSEVIGLYILTNLKYYPTDFIAHLSKQETSKIFNKYSDFAAYELYFVEDIDVTIDKMKNHINSICSCSDNPVVLKFLDRSRKLALTY